jgi:hypothetical protein
MSPIPFVSRGIAPKMGVKLPSKKSKKKKKRSSTREYYERRIY